MRVDALNENDDVCCAINDAIMERDDTTYQSGDFVDGTDGCRLLNYYKAYRITAFDDTLPKVDNKQEVIDIIQRLATKQITDIKKCKSYALAIFCVLKPRKKFRLYTDNTLKKW